MCCLNLRLAWGTRTCTKCAFEKSCYLFLVCFSQQWTARNNFVVLQLWYNFLLICIVCHSKITLKSFRILVTPTETNAAKFGYIFVIWLLSSWVHCSAVWCDHIHVIKLMCWLLWRHPHLCNCCHIVCARYPSSLFVNIPPAPPPSHAWALHIILSVPLSKLWQKFLMLLKHRQSLANCQCKLSWQVLMVQYALNEGLIVCSKLKIMPYVLADF